MANIRKRGSKWQVQVRRAGQPHITKTFNKNSDEQVWSRDMDAKGNRGEIGRVGDKDLTFGCLLKKYRAEVVSNNLAVSQEGYIVDRLLGHSLSKTKLMGISPEPFAKYRDERVKLVSGSTVRREFGVI